ncbi:ATP synthase F1 subunit gamma [Mycoplasma crocodyli]|uniref:ATP synthase gamma chain n=1 Tax=Mycoplasma crocodyli (strain ATCC 51981 / MP145) TaxID=512564 RepID=D5E5G0_MYCCM|nr:ATP synthase F1 subunit gamma [Mycoplasma crocodyli]ADE19667.1 ATP synthase F1, gamma subunit [Mycoplasma crocodyli MP145]
MASLTALKSRINVIQNTKKITHAMELVASSKLRKARENFQSIQSYQNNLETIFNELLMHITPEEYYSVFPKTKGIDSKLYILITSDLGLCGSYNSNLVNMLKNKLTDNDKIIIIGSKGYAALAHGEHKDKIITVYNDYGDTVSYTLGSEISRIAEDLYYHKKISQVNIIYTKFISNVVQEPVDLRIFPFEIESKNYINVSPIEFEPNIHTILKNSVPLYMASMIYCLGTSSKISEMASRRTAMENATDNAQELTHELNLEYNRKRQSLITQEINEIVSGADAT